jgi:uncharacterized protein
VSSTYLSRAVFIKDSSRRKDMQCPVCDERLRTIERSGVEIDMCPGCKGMWLDRGVLDRIVADERSSDRPSPDSSRNKSDYGDQDDRDHRDHDRGDRDPQSGRKRRGSLLGDLLGGLGGD